jgi:RNA polymerase sigma-70 factor (ECF subfamily)
MAGPTQTEVTKLLEAASTGDTQAADKLVSLVYDDLRRVAAKFLHYESPGHSWDSAELVDEAYMKLVGQDVDWNGKTHFIAIAARSMRRLLVDHARSKLRDKRGGDRKRVDLDEHLKVSQRDDRDLLAVDEAIKKLAKLDPQQAQIVELRFFGGMTVQEVADVLQIPKRSVEREWTMIRAWLRSELDESKRE